MRCMFWSSRHFSHELPTLEANLTSSSLQWASDVITEAMGAGTSNHEVQCVHFLSCVWRHSLQIYDASMPRVGSGGYGEVLEPRQGEKRRGDNQHTAAQY